MTVSTEKTIFELRPTVIPEQALWRLNADQYLRLDQTVFLPDDKVELHDGILVALRADERHAAPTLLVDESGWDSDLLYLYRLTPAQYQSATEQGILTEADTVELLKGYLIAIMTKNPPHTVATELIRDSIQRLLKPTWFVRAQEPLITGNSVPEPDVMIVRGSPRDYLMQHPSAADVALVVEVADSSVAQDRSIKLEVYAQAGIPVYWIVNLAERCIEVYTDPYTFAQDSGGRYLNQRVYAGSESIPLVVMGEILGSLALEALLP
jgi:Uma2 family endonuclease